MPFPEAVAQGFVALLNTVLHTGETQFGQGMRFEVNVPPDGLRETFLDFIYQPIRDASGKVSGIFVDGYDVTDRVRAARAQQANETRLYFLDRLQSETEALGDPVAIMTATARLLGRHLDANVCAFADIEPDEGTDRRRGCAAPSPEDGGRRPADRRHRPRFQQPADGHRERHAPFAA